MTFACYFQLNEKLDGLDISGPGTVRSYRFEMEHVAHMAYDYTQENNGCHVQKASAVLVIKTPACR